MSLNQQLIRQRDFSGGEVDPDAVRRDDLDLLKFAIRYGRNLVSTHTGAIARRPGRRFLFQDDGILTEFKPYDDLSYRIIFVAGAVKVRHPDGTLLATLSAPWGSGDLTSLVWEPDGAEIIVCWGGRPKVIYCDPVRTWSIGDYKFSTGINKAVKVPFYRFAATTGIRMTPDGRTGEIAVLFSDNVLDAEHVGTIFRYAGRQFRITVVTNPQAATAEVLEELPPTWSFLISNSKGFSVGQIIETDTTGVRMEVTGISTKNINAVALNTLTSPVEGEKLVGPNASEKIVSFAEVKPEGATQWDEQFISDFRGWPRSVSKDRQRLIFCDFAQLKNAICWSAIGNNRDFEVGADATDAIFETIDAECTVLYIAGGYDEFAITDKGVFYIPISIGTPLQPGSVEFRTIFSSEIAKIRPVQVTEGLLFVDGSKTGVYSISATGQTSRPYVASEVNRFHRHLFSNVVSLAVTSATEEFQSRQIYAVNGDGTLVAGQFNPDRDYVGWLKWDGGAVKSVSGNYGTALFMTTYAFGGSPVTVAEELDYSLLFDCATTIVPGAATAFYAGKTIDVFSGGFYLGQRVVPGNGILTGFGDYSSITIGLNFGWAFRPLFTTFDDGEPVGQGEKRRKIADMKMTVRGTREFQCGNRIFGSYRGGEDMALPVPARDDVYRYRETGRSYDPVIELSSTFPGPFKLIELTTRLTV